MSIKQRIIKLDHKKIIKLPVLLICYDRPELLNKLINTLLKYKVRNLYFSQDGCDDNDEQVIKRHKKVRLIIENLKLKKNIKVNFLKKNFGKQFGPPKAISWFFRKVKMGIIIEDDIFPSKSFLLLSEILLRDHKKDKSIFQISGTGTLKNNFGKITYASSHFFVHGWATWRDRWKFYNGKIGNINKLIKSKNFKINVPTLIGRLYWINIFNDFKKGKHKTWDYPLAYMCLLKNYSCIKPSINMITNKGYLEKNKLSYRKRVETKKIYHLKNLKNQFKYEKKGEEWIYYNLSFRYQLSLIFKYLINKFI